MKIPAQDLADARARLAGTFRNLATLQGRRRAFRREGLLAADPKVRELEARQIGEQLSVASADAILALLESQALLFDSVFGAAVERHLEAVEAARRAAAAPTNGGGTT